MSRDRHTFPIIKKFFKSWWALPLLIIAYQRKGFSQTNSRARKKGKRAATKISTSLDTFLNKALFAPFEKAERLLVEMGLPQE